jgi:hypothetical protein
MSPASEPIFDSGNPNHKTTADWERAGNNDWFSNCYVWACRAGESRVLLRCGGVLRLYWSPERQRILVEELPQ